MKKRYIEFDILRGMAIIGVILIHVTSNVIDHSDQSLTYGTAVFINQLMRFSVPSFLFLSGFGLTVSNKLDSGYANFLYKQLSKIVLLYLIWNIIYYLYNNNSFDTSHFFEQLLLGSNHYHLYFVPIIISCYVLFPVLDKIGKSSLGVSLVLLLTIFSQIKIDLINIEYITREINLLNWLFYFVLGIWFSDGAEKKVQFLKSKSKFIIGGFLFTLIGVFLESYFLIDEIGKGMATTSMRPSIILLSVLFIAMVVSLDWDKALLKNQLMLLATWSYGIYLSHAFILSIFRDWYLQSYSLGTAQYMIFSVLIVLPTSLVFSIAINIVIEEIGGLRSRSREKLA